MSRDSAPPPKDETQTPFSESYTDALDREWPDCPSCDSSETAVTPETGEWECRDCGCQWMPAELPDDETDADEIPTDIETMVEELFASLDGGMNR